ncbi:MAG: metallophosphoesterase, partial [Chthoniobacteraceae bacterium]
GWPAPIHQLLVQNHVSIVFHGHDHIFAKQDLDGIVYQEVPQPGNPAKGDPNTVPRTAAEYGYLSGKLLGAPGYMRITVAPDKVTADLVRSYLPEQESAGRKNHETAFSYTIPAH